MKICLIGSSLAAGGAERVMATMANHWAQQGRDVTLITISTDESFYKVDPRVHCMPLGLYIAPPVQQASQRRRKAIATKLIKRTLLTVADPLLHFRHALRLRRAIKTCSPSVVVSFIDQVNVLTLIATRRLRMPVLVSARVDPRYHHIARMCRILRRLLYPSATKVVIQCEQVREALPYVPTNRIVVIPNPVAGDQDALAQRGKAQRTDRLKIVGMGRLAPQKGFDLLIRAFANLPPECGYPSLEIWGQGSMLAELKTLASKLGMDARVRFCGLTHEPRRILASADIFVLPSRYEGFPNVLLEAMSAGVPVISFDCPSGPRAIIRDGLDGLLVPPEDVDVLTQTIRRLIENPGERVRLASRAVEVNQRFSLERIMSQWESLLGCASAS